MRTPAGIESLSEGSWNPGSVSGEWSPGGCGCGTGSGERCSCGGPCGCKGESDGSCGGGKPPGEVSLLQDYDGEIWASSVRSDLAGEPSHTVRGPRARKNQVSRPVGEGVPWVDPTSVWAHTLANGVCMVGQGDWCCIEVLCHTLRKAVNNLGSLKAARRVKSFKHCWLEVTDCGGYTTSYEVEPEQAAGRFLPGPKSKLVAGAKKPAPRDDNGDVLPVAKQKDDDIESRGWDCWTCEPVEGGCLDPVCSLLGQITDNYPWYDSYSFAGPNSNTFVAYMANQLGIDVHFDPLDAGAGYADYEDR
jgi:hypothetical protein